MQDVIYIHGFLSSPQSTKAQVTRRWLQQAQPDIHFHCPSLSSYPDEARRTLLETIEQCGSNPGLIGSSLGGFWASHLIEQNLARRAVLINPAISPHLRFKEYLHQPLKSYYSDDVFTLGDGDLDTLQSCERPVIKFPGRYWLMVQTGDEVLDYRLATVRYQSCRQLVEPGGNHSFENYARWLPDIFQFLKDGQ